MSNERLSQEEINALLNDEPVEITEMEKDALGELGNISFGSGATALSLLEQEGEIDYANCKYHHYATVN